METDARFRELYEQTYRLTGALAAAGCRQTADIGDIMQEVYLELYRILKKRGAGYIHSPEALIRKLTKQKLADYYRTLARREEILAEPMEDGTEAEMADITALSVEDVVADAEILSWTDRFLDEKGEITRKIFHLYYRFGVSVPQIAQMLGRSEADVKNKLYRTLREIREQWKGE